MRGYGQGDASRHSRRWPVLTNPEALSALVLAAAAFAAAGAAASAALVAAAAAVLRDHPEHAQAPHVHGLGQLAPGVDGGGHGERQQAEGLRLDGVERHLDA